MRRVRASEATDTYVHRGQLCDVSERLDVHRRDAARESAGYAQAARRV